jgi:hypothetical protein
MPQRRNFMLKRLMRIEPTDFPPLTPVSLAGSMPPPFALGSDAVSEGPAISPSLLPRNLHVARSWRAILSGPVMNIIKIIKYAYL